MTQLFHFTDKNPRAVFKVIPLCKLPMMGDVQRSRGWLHWDRDGITDKVNKMLLLLNGTVDLVLGRTDKAVVSHQG